MVKIDKRVMLPDCNKSRKYTVHNKLLTNSYKASKKISFSCKFWNSIICCFIPFTMFKWYVQKEDLLILRRYSQREKCPNTHLFLVHFFLYSVWIQENTDQKKLQILTLFTQCLYMWVSCLCMNFDVNITALLNRLYLFCYLETLIKLKTILKRILKVLAPSFHSLRSSHVLLVWTVTRINICWKI